MAKWGKGRFLKFKDRAYDLLKEYPEGLTAEGGNRVAEKGFKIRRCLWRCRNSKHDWKPLQGNDMGDFG